MKHMKFQLKRLLGEGETCKTLKMEMQYEHKDDLNLNLPELSCMCSLRRKTFFALRYNQLRFTLYFLYQWGVVRNRSAQILETSLGFQNLHAYL